ncbi:MAG: hypothetical protein KGI57_03935 [Hyphomicrobiales bacterium]|nr:hypothetical protein [Hyphomicrobiales bacterium]MDE2016836.1 hypothetical protein [Hyphomicrobiales bacterium]
MLRIAVLVWTLVGGVLALASIAVVVTVPALAADDARLIPWGVAAGLLLGVPVSLLVARRMVGAEAKTLR